MKKTITIIIAVLFVCFGLIFWFWDHGISKNGIDITMFQEIDTDKKTVITLEHSSRDGQYELDKSETKTLKDGLLEGKYRAISESVYHGTYQGDHILLFMRTENDHVLTIEICGYEKLSVIDETEQKTEYYLIEEKEQLKEKIDHLNL